MVSLGVVYVGFSRLTSRVREVLTVSLGLGHFWEVDWQL